MKSAVLAVGTELTDGQIVNRNAAWISERMKGFGARCDLHLTVPDERKLIIDGLDQAARFADLIFVSGGLGPTSDDFTRELVAEWSGFPLEFHEPSWQMIRDRLGARGYPVTEIQRQQCFFPRGSVVLPNSQGTANAFRLRAKDRELIVLPGPPREIEAVWDDHLHSWLAEICRDLDPMVTRSWDLIGLGESQVAELAGPIVEGSPFEVGYRVHLPYVEFKLSHLRSEAELAKPYVAQLESAFGGWVASRDGADVARELAGRLAGIESFEIIDEVSGAFLFSRLAAPFQAVWNSSRFRIRSDGESDPLCRASMWIRRLDSHSVRVGLRVDRQNRETVLESPDRLAKMPERRQQYFLERALIWWTQVLNSAPSDSRG